MLKMRSIEQRLAGIEHKVGRASEADLPERRTFVNDDGFQCIESWYINEQGQPEMLRIINQGNVDFNKM